MALNSPEPNHGHWNTENWTDGMLISRPTVGDRRSCIGAVILAALVTSPLNAATADIVWPRNAMGATPTPATLEDGLTDALAGRVVFRQGKTGTANLICPIGSVSQNLSKFTVRSLHLTYHDGDGKEGPSVVSAALRRIRKSDGHVETVKNGGVSSNSPNASNSGPGGFATHQSATPGNTIDAGLDFKDFYYYYYYYYVQITMRRSDAAVPLAVQGAFLTN